MGVTRPSLLAARPAPRPVISLHVDEIVLDGVRPIQRGRIERALGDAMRGGAWRAGDPGAAIGAAMTRALGSDR